MKYTKQTLPFLAVLAVPIFFQLCCTQGLNGNYFSSSSDNFVPYKSAVHIKIKTSFKVCVQQNGEVCFDKSSLAFGSGSVVKNNVGSSVVLTANHICSIELPTPPSFITLKNVKFEYVIYDFDGNSYEKTKVLKTDSAKDACLMTVENLFMPAVKISKNGPRIGEKVLYIGYPKGIYISGSSPIFEGFYSGSITMPNSLKGEVATYSLFVAGGSSGSMIVNRYGQLIGMVHSGFSVMDHFLFSCTHDFLKDFLKGV
jgi:S1-C subfamily serine protease